MLSFLLFIAKVVLVLVCAIAAIAGVLWFGYRIDKKKRRGKDIEKPPRNPCEDCRFINTRECRRDECRQHLAYLENFKPKPEINQKRHLTDGRLPRGEVVADYSYEAEHYHQQHREDPDY